MLAGGRFDPRSPVSQKLILCIDDDPAILSYEKALLERSGYSVTTAAYAREGLVLDHVQIRRRAPRLRDAEHERLLIPTKATALRRNQRPRTSFPLAGFEVTFIGRFWVTPEVRNEALVVENNVEK
jgi:hypothetical protein